MKNYRNGKHLKLGCVFLNTLYRPDTFNRNMFLFIFVQVKVGVYFQYSHMMRAKDTFRVSFFA